MATNDIAESSTSAPTEDSFEKVSGTARAACICGYVAQGYSDVHAGPLEVEFDRSPTAATVYPSRNGQVPLDMTSRTDEGYTAGALMNLEPDQAQELGEHLIEQAELARKVQEETNGE